MTTPATSPTSSRSGMRFMVRLDHARPTRFGERSGAGLQWTVTPYMARRADGALIGALMPRRFPSLGAAHAHAHDLAARQRARLVRLYERGDSTVAPMFSPDHMPGAPGRSFVDGLAARLHAGSEA